MIWILLLLGVPLSCILLVLGAPLTLLLHELAHVLATKATGGRVTAFRPWPHRYDGRWYFGRMMRVGGDDHTVAWAPLAKATCLLAWYCGWSLVVPAVLALAAWELVDLLWWWRGWLLRRGDGGKARVEEGR